MPKKKSVSFDAMVKFFMQHYNIPTRKDVDKLMKKMERLEVLVQDTVENAKSGGKEEGEMLPAGAKPGMTASDVVFEVVAAAGENGIGFLEIQEKTGFGEKKIRNIVFRLNKLGKIERINRGVYAVV